ncbi:MAG: hypothetical protein ACRC35_05875 [Angustibacter sp.]
MSAHDRICVDYGALESLAADSQDASAACTAASSVVAGAALPPGAFGNLHHSSQMEDEAAHVRSITSAQLHGSGNDLTGQSVGLRRARHNYQTTDEGNADSLCRIRNQLGSNQSGQYYLSPD